MKIHKPASEKGTSSVLLNRRFLACPACGWVHYVMTPEEKAENDLLLERLTERYRLTAQERELYEAAFRQCLRCETPAATFRAAEGHDLDRAAGGIVTPVCVGPEVGTQ